MFDVHREDDGVQVQLFRPSNIQFADTTLHFFSCVDSRSKYALIGAPGGDMGEFIIGLCALEQVRVHS
jgi:hypothetical protein